MNDELRNALKKLDTDLEGVKTRFIGNEDLYFKCLGEFLIDPTMDDLETAIEKQAWNDAFTAAHALKGLAGNMGFVPLFHVSAEMVIHIRNGKKAEIADSCRELRAEYSKITDVIRKYCAGGNN